MNYSRIVARGGMLTALAVVLLLLASLTPAGWIGLCACAGVVPAAPLSRGRVGLAVGVYLATALLGWLIVPSKLVALGYTVVFGLYSLVKYAIEKLRVIPARWACKLAFAVLSAVVFWTVVHAFAAFVAISPLTPAVLLVVYLSVFIVYDFAFTRLIGFLRRIFPED